MPTPPSKDLLLAPRLEPEQIAAILGPHGFANIAAADRNLQSMGDDPQVRRMLADILEDLLTCAAESADPDQALNLMERFARATGNKAHLFSYLKTTPHTLEVIAKTMGASPFMAEILIRDPGYLYWVSDPEVLNSVRTKEQMRSDVAGAIEPLKTPEKKLEMLRILKRKEILHIGIRDLLRLSTVEETVASLSALAEVLIESACQVCASEMTAKYGSPRHRDSHGMLVPTRFAVLGMGKLGGGELNFSSDVDLIYLYQSDEGQASINTDGNQAATLSSAEYFKRLSQSLTSALSDVTNEGYVYRVDLRLRPEGRIGALAHSMEASRRYYSSRATTWERLALLKAWPVAGDQDLGLEFLEEVRPFVYGLPFDAAELDDLKRIKAGIDKKMNARRQAHRNVKLGLGGIREVEFIVQSLQVAHGRLHPHVCDRNTLRALDALCEASILTAQERDELRRAYIFLRDVENKLQMVLDLQTHTIPSRRMEARSCASRLGYRDTKTSSAVDQFLSDHQGHTERVNRIFRRLFESKEPSRFSRRY